MAKTHHELREVLSQLHDWAGIELRIAETPEARKAWRDVTEWAQGTAAKHKLTLSQLNFPNGADGPPGNAGLGHR